MGCCGIHSKKNLGKILCFPLAVFVLLYSLILIGYSTWIFVTLASHHDHKSWEFIISLVVNCFICLAGALGLVAVAAKWSGGLTLLGLVTKFTIVMLVIHLVSEWVKVICFWMGVDTAYISKTEDSKNVYIALGVVTGLAIINIILCFIALSAVASLKKVYEVGGNGFEMKSHKEIAGRMEADSDDEP